jgi:hypothetical protein
MCDVVDIILYAVQLNAFEPKSTLDLIWRDD